MENECVLQQFRSVRGELLKGKNFQTGGLGPPMDPGRMPDGGGGGAGGEAPGS